jgi:hypothetical protein
VVRRRGNISSAESVASLSASGHPVNVPLASAQAGRSPGRQSTERSSGCPTLPSTGA